MGAGSLEDIQSKKKSTNLQLESKVVVNILDISTVCIPVIARPAAHTVFTHLLQWEFEWKSDSREGSSGYFQSHEMQCVYMKYVDLN